MEPLEVWWHQWWGAFYLRTLCYARRLGWTGNEP